MPVVGLRQALHQWQYRNGNRGANQGGNAQLVEQVSVNRQRLERVGDIAKKVDVELSRAKLREIYKKAHVTRQCIITKAEPRNPNQAKMETQKKNIEFAQRRVSYWASQGYEVIQVDECVFQSDQGNKRTWAPIAEPLSWAQTSYK